MDRWIHANVFYFWDFEIFWCSGLWSRALAFPFWGFDKISAYLTIIYASSYLIDNALSYPKSSHVRNFSFFSLVQCNLPTPPLNIYLPLPRTFGCIRLKVYLTIIYASSYLIDNALSYPKSSHVRNFSFFSLVQCNLPTPPLNIYLPLPRTFGCIRLKV